MSSQPIMSRSLVIDDTEANEPRWAVEQRKLAVFPGWHLVGGASGVTAAVGTLTSNTGHTYRMRIELDNFPSELPQVMCVGWEPDAGTPHVWPDGGPCILDPDRWSSKYTVAWVVAKTALWLAKYETYQVERVWPGSDAHGGTRRRRATGRSNRGADAETTDFATWIRSLLG